MSHSSIETHQRLAQKKLIQILKLAQSFSGLSRLGPKPPWSVTLEWVGSKTMTRLNGVFRGKFVSTDILSFPTTRIFQEQGLLGELVICLPVLKAQAKKYGTLRQEIEVLIVHGVLHLLGLDHEVNPKEAKRMARWEVKLLEALWGVRSKDPQKRLGLIDRVYSGMKVS